ncbi:hypothetical protein EDD11_007586 [Mortierella claussenii]|nr:hypothetical protein EDD11_007586 [Mortierella claussenii]
MAATSRFFEFALSIGAHSHRGPWQKVSWTSWRSSTIGARAFSSHRSSASSMSATGAGRSTGTATHTLSSTRDRRPKSRPLGGGRGREETLDPSMNNSLRRTVMDEVAIPGRYQTYFKPDKRAIRKAEEESRQVNRSRSPKKQTAAKWHNNSNRDDREGQGGGMNNVDENLQHQGQQPKPKKSGFENVAWRALEQIYAHDVMPHPLMSRTYMEVVKINLLPDRRTFQLWYRPRPDDKASEEQIVEAVGKHSRMFKAMLARHASSSTSSRLVFQLVRQSDLQASMEDLWTKLEQNIHLQDDTSALK